MNHAEGGGIDQESTRARQDRDVVLNDAQRAGNGNMTLSAAKNVDYQKPLSQQKKPDYVCEPGDPRVKKFGWTKSKFQGYLSIEEKTIWISAIWSKQRGKGNYSRMIKKIHKAGYDIKVPSPFPHMEEICKHFGFVKTQEFEERIGDHIDVWVLTAGNGNGACKEMTEPAKYICVVCGRQLPDLPKEEMIRIGCALKRNDEQYIYFCIGYRHTKEEIAAAITGVPVFKKASDLKKGLAGNNGA